MNGSGLRQSGAVYRMPIGNLKAQMARLPEQPGVYLYDNGQGETLYVGKARVLRDRVRSYLGAYGTSPRIDALLDEAERLEVIVTDSVIEALALENNLIKQRAPQVQHPPARRQDLPVPAVDDRRSISPCPGGAAGGTRRHVYAGPFMPAALARRTMSLTHRLFGIRSCNEVITGERPRPCLEYDIKRCAAPCVRDICPADEYQVAVQHTRLFLEGRNDELLADPARTDVRGGGRRALRAGCAGARRHPDHRDAAVRASRRWRRPDSATVTPSA